MPAFVKNHRFDMLVANPLGRALFSEMYAEPVCGADTVRFVFLSPAARRFYVDWERIARGAVGALRIEAGKNPYDRELSNLIGELSTRSDAFRVMWGAHDVHVFHEGTKRLRHPVVGELELDFESMNLPDGSGLVVALYNAAPGSAAADALKLLASWSATAEAADVQAAEADSGN
ncbi:MmyB family transcriptional regulator, partial [Streptomyces rubiginosohelvolus]